VLEVLRAYSLRHFRLRFGQSAGSIDHGAPLADDEFLSLLDCRRGSSAGPHHAIHRGDSTARSPADPDRGRV